MELERTSSVGWFIIALFLEQFFWPPRGINKLLFFEQHSGQEDFPQPQYHIVVYILHHDGARRDEVVQAASAAD